MEKKYNSKIGLALLVLLTLISPFGVFTYAFIKIALESIMSATAVSLSYITANNLIFSISMSAISTLITVFVGGIISFYISNLNNPKHNYGILNIILVLPHIGFAYIIYLFFSSTGFLFRFLDLLGISSNFSLVNDPYGIGIVINYVLKEAPFVIFYLLATNNPENRRLVFAAKDLGANFMQSFFKIYIPLNSIQIVSISIVIFAFVLGNYEVPFLLGANSPQFLSVTALNNFQSIDVDQNIASYLKVIIIFITSYITSIVLRILARYLK